MAVAVAVMTAEALHFPVQSHRAVNILNAFQQAAPTVNVRVRRTTQYAGGSQALLLWGPGAPDRREPIRQQLAAGGHAVVFDLAYWQRDHKFRVSIDAPHPQAWVMRRTLSDSRLLADGVKPSSAWDKNGPVIVAGIGDKAGVQYGSDTVRTWERAMIARVQADGRRVIYRPKKAGGHAPGGVTISAGGHVDTILRGASAVVTWHSNVAVDAIRLGIPAICRDGAAAAICPSEWDPTLQPIDESARRQFLANLAWFQWMPTEAKACWRWLLEVLA